VALHPRTARQMFSGRADWSRIARLKEALSIPVVGNGDVLTAADAVRMLRETGCDAVMIGRASMTNPWIYRQTQAILQGRAPADPTLEERRELILDHFRLLVEREEAGFALHKLRTFTGWYTHGLPGGRSLRTRIGRCPLRRRFSMRCTCSSTGRWPRRPEPPLACSGGPHEDLEARRIRRPGPLPSGEETRRGRRPRSRDRTRGGDPRKFLEGILLQLKRGRILVSRRGVEGGYALARPPEEVTLGEVIRLLDGPLSPLGSVSEIAARIERHPRHAPFYGVLRDVRNAVAGILDRTSLADLIDGR